MPESPVLTSRQGLEYRIAEPDPTAQRPGPMLVLLHEGLGSMAMWKDFPDALASRTGRPVLVYSRRGYGGSRRRPVAPGPDFMHREAREALPALLEELGVRAPVLVGHSDGASIAVIYAGSGYPVAGLVLMAPHVFVEAVTVESIAAARHAFQTTDLAQRLGRYHEHPRSMFREWTDVWLSEAFRSWNIEALVAPIHAPMLLIQNEDDPYGTAAQLHAIEGSATAPVETLMVPGEGHAPHAGNQEETLAAVARFVAALAGYPT